MRFLTLLMIALVGCSSSKPSTRAIENVEFPVGDFALTDHTGKPTSERNLRGKVWIASFVFTHCPGPCKEVTATVTQLQNRLADEANVRFVSVTLDPKRDTESVLRDYAKLAGAEGERWLFLTGDEAKIHELAVKRFKQSSGAKPGSGVKPGEEFSGHSTWLSVVDKHGVIRAMYEGTRSSKLPPDQAEAEYQAGLTRLVDKVRTLAKE